MTVHIEHTLEDFQKEPNLETYIALLEAISPSEKVNSVPTDLVGRALGALYDYGSVPGKAPQLYLVTITMESIHGLGAYYHMTWEDAGVLGIYHLLPDSDIVRQVAIDQNFTGRVSEFLEMCKLLAGASGGRA